MRLIQRLSGRLYSFFYNFCWSKYVWLLDGWLPKCSVTIPLIGYAILFNDTVAEHLAFKTLTSDAVSQMGLSSSARLKLLYIGLILMASANILYYLRRPFVHKLGANSTAFERNAFDLFIVDDYMRIHSTIRYEGHVTPYGQYYDADYDAFLIAALGPDEMRDGVSGPSRGNWDNAKRKSGSLLRGMLRDHYFRYDKSRQRSLSLCLIISMLGYALFLLPSVDLFLKVFAVVFYGVI